jgi:hypothetical protein
MRLPVLGTCIALFGAAGMAAEAAFPVAGSYGFDWLTPDSAKCVRIAEVDAKQFKVCEFHTSGAFGLDLAYHVCPTAKRGEFLVFKSQAACQEALETMQANAP